MQKKNDEIWELKLFVKIIFRAIIDPIKYAPPSPRKILAFGKLNNVNESNIIIWEIEIIARSKLLLAILIYVKIKLIIIKFIDNNPLKPSIKLAPLIMKRKQSRTKIVENNLLETINDKNCMSILRILIGKKYINIKRNITISDNLSDGLIFILRSSIKPIKNIEVPISKCSYKILE